MGSSGRGDQICGMPSCIEVPNPGSAFTGKFGSECVMSTDLRFFITSLCRWAEGDSGIQIEIDVSAHDPGTDKTIHAYMDIQELEMILRQNQRPTRANGKAFPQLDTWLVEEIGSLSRRTGCSEGWSKVISGKSRRAITARMARCSHS